MKVKQGRRAKWKTKLSSLRQTTRKGPWWLLQAIQRALETAYFASYLAVLKAGGWNFHIHQISMEKGHWHRSHPKIHCTWDERPSSVNLRYWCKRLLIIDTVCLCVPLPWLPTSLEFFTLLAFLTIEWCMLSFLRTWIPTKREQSSSI